MRNLPEDGYRGEYLLRARTEIALKENGQTYFELSPISFFEDYAKEFLLEKIKQTLEDYGVTL